jgi:hypothetical protein
LTGDIQCAHPIRFFAYLVFLFIATKTTHLSNTFDSG